MGLTKTDLFTEEQNELARIAKALGHPARIAIIQHLLASNRCINGDLVKELGLAQATISQHLRELRDIGMIAGTIEGKAMSYCIHPDGWEKIEAGFKRLFDRYRSNKTCC